MNEKLPVSKSVLLPEDDAPELTEEWFNEADMYRAGKLVRRGRPAKAITKVALKLRLDRNIVDTFKAGGPGWQTRINQALDEWLSSEAFRNSLQQDAGGASCADTSQIEFWAKVGRAALENPELPVNFIVKSLASLAEPREEALPFESCTNGDE